MARKPNVFPSYLLHKQSGQARVRIEGKDYLLGPYGSDESRIAYGKLIAQIGSGIQIDPIADSKRGRLPRNESDDAGPSVGECCLVFLRHAETHYVKNECFLNSIYDLGDGAVDFPAIHKVLKEINYKGWLCVDLDTARKGPRASYERCGQYVVNKLENIYK